MARIAVAVAALALFAPVAHAAPAWTCHASAGWVAAGGPRSDAPGVGGEPCPSARATAQGASDSAGSVTPSGGLSVDGGASGQTTDARKPLASVDLKSVTIQNSDGSLVLTASNVSDHAQASCDPNRNPVLTSAASVGSVTLNGRPVDTSQDYSEPGVGVNGAPLFGKIAIHFGEAVKGGDSSLLRRALHLVVTDRNGGVVFEVVAGEVTVGRDGAVCAPPPLCPPGTQPQAGRCVAVQVAPLPPPPPPAPQLPPPPSVTPKPKPKPQPGICADTTARVGAVSNRRLAQATLCLMNAIRRKHHLRALRTNAQLANAAARHARSMLTGRYFAHDEPSGPTFLDRVLHSGYLDRFGHWSIGENLGWGWSSGASPRAMLAAWMRSPPHRRNILNGAFHDVGIAVRPGSPSGRRDGRPATYVVDFGGFDRAR